MNNPINWNEVTVGETELVKNDDYCKMKVLAIDGHYVWVKGEAYHTFSKDELGDWTIYDPWVDITAECEWRHFGLSDHLWAVEYKHEIIRHNDRGFKVECPRVWKRKET